MFTSFEFLQSSITDLNNDELYAVFDLVIQEMNYRKTKDLLEVQRKMRIEKAKEEYKKCQNITNTISCKKETII